MDNRLSQLVIAQFSHHVLREVTPDSMELNMRNVIAAATALSLLAFAMPMQASAQSTNQPTPPPQTKNAPAKSTTAAKPKLSTAKKTKRYARRHHGRHFAMHHRRHHAKRSGPHRMAAYRSTTKQLHKKHPKHAAPQS